MMFRLATLLLCMLLPVVAAAQGFRRLTLPHRDQLPTAKVLFVLQDSEGFLWYATDGGGLCRDDGRKVDVFRSDASHPTLLGSNTVLCLAQKGIHIIIGTSHGANVLDKRDYSIRRLNEVDDKRVDDILVDGNGHWWLTANKKVYEYAPDGKWIKTYHVGNKYIFRLHEDAHGRLWCREWEGGTLLLRGGRFVRVTSAWPSHVDFSRVTTDRQGRLLVADGLGGCYALCRGKQKRWEGGTPLTRQGTDSIRCARHLAARPAAVATDHDGSLWYSTGKDIRCMTKNGKETKVANTKDVSAMAFTDNGDLWLATIFGQLYRYGHGRMVTDKYASNEYGDGVTAMRADGGDRLVMVSDRYTRIYDTRRHTFRQQSREPDGVYCIELQPTKPGERWSCPQAGKSAGEPDGATAYRWLWCIGAALLVCMVLTVAYVIKSRSTAAQGPVPAQALSAGEAPFATIDDEWLKKAITQVERHLDEADYSVGQLSQDMCMSRMTLYRRIQSLTGQSPTEFMRTIRLHRAADLLRQGHMTVTEISYATGFSSVSYFSRCFRTLFGVPPTQYTGGK